MQGVNTLPSIDMPQQRASINKPCEILITKDTMTTINQNTSYGHNINIKPATNILRIYHQNIRGAKTYQNWNRYKEGIQQLKQWGVGITTLAETNTQWTQTNISAAQAMTHSVTSLSKISTSGSSEATDTDYQPGGTACVAMGKWTGRVTTRITDSSGLGRWSGFRLQGKNQKSLIVISAYRPTPSNDPSDRTCHSQQWRILRARQNSNPNPRKTFITDLTTQINKWRDENSEIIIGIDANESVTEKNSQIYQLLQDTNLEQLVDTDPAPATFIRGTKTIDFIIGTSAIKRVTVANGYLPFYSGAWDSDHRGLFIDVNVDTILENMTDVDTTPKRILQSSNKLMACKFLNNLAKDKQLKLMHEKIMKLTQKKKFTKKDLQQLEQIDTQFTLTLLTAEQKCRKSHNQPWSVVVHQLDLTYKYWKIYHKGKNNKVNIEAKLTDLLAGMVEPNQQWQGDGNRPPKHQLIRSKKALKEARAIAWDLRRLFRLTKLKYILKMITS
jgi:hypothetical protein